MFCLVCAMCGGKDCLILVKQVSLILSSWLQVRTCQMQSVEDELWRRKRVEWKSGIGVVNQNMVFRSSFSGHSKGFLLNPACHIIGLHLWFRGHARIYGDCFMCWR